MRRVITANEESAHNILQALPDAPAPAACVWIGKETSAYGFPYFGKDYGQTSMRWLHRWDRQERHRGEPGLRAGTRCDVGFLEPR